MRTTDDSDIAFVPRGLTSQCRRLIESYHTLIGFSSLPDILWKAQLGTFIERHAELALLHRGGSRARSAKTSRECYLKLATAILSLEVLASGFAGWSKIYPEAG
ncbi:MAG: hypothetical protein M3N50_06450, partial [Pseudomonadota bacterium]|nr:hypothetical protein [Pseudomonadota bacterium]